MLKTVLALCAALACAALFAATAGASELIDRNATGVKLYVNANDEALLTYKADGKLKRVLVWGARNALPPAAESKQLEFKIDYSGGYGKYKQDYWKTFPKTCDASGVPALGLSWLVTGCKAPDGSFWAVQSWQRALPNYGVKPTAKQAVWELRLSHWDGELPALTVHMDYSYRKFHHLYGSFTYAGSGVFGFRSTPAGVPLDTFGRNLYVDVLDSQYGKGWKRENSFLMHQPGGTFCYGFYAHGKYPAVTGKRVRATIIGPGLTPDIKWEGPAPGPYDKDLELQDLEQQRAILKDDKACKLQGV